MDRERREKEMSQIPLDLIKPSPYQPRLYFDLEDIRGSIMKDGILVPLTVRKKDGYYEIIDGERRWRLAKELGYKTVPCVVKTDVDDEVADQMSWNLNTLRKEYTVEERAKHFRMHQEQRMSARAIGRIHGYSNVTVSSYLSIFKLPEEYQQYVWDGKFGIAKIQRLYERGLLDESVKDLTPALTFINQSITQDLKDDEFEKLLTDTVGKVEEIRLKTAKKAIGKVTPEIKEPETPEDFEKMAVTLRKEAERRKTAEQKAEEKRQKLIAQTRKSLNATRKKIDGAEKIIDVSVLREQLNELEKSLEQNPAEAREQLIALGKQVDGAKKQRQKEIEEENRKKREEEERHRLEEEMKKKLEEEKKRLEEEAKKKAKEELLEDRGVLREAIAKYSEIKRAEREEARSRLEQSVLPIEVTEADLVHKVIIGDAKDVLRSVPASSIDMVVTSPPYFGLKEYEDELGIDTEDLSRYLDDLKAIFKECFRVLKDGTFICVVIGQYTSEENSHFIPAHIAHILEEIGFNYKREHIWVKPLGIQGIWNRGTTSFLQKPYPRNTMINIHHEHILIYQKGDKPTIFYGRNPLTEEEVKKYCWSVWELYVSDVKDHPAPYPESIPYRLIKMYSYEGEVVLDPFLGSGTTMKVAKSLKRRSIGIEVSPEYLDIIKRSVGGADFLYHDGQKKLDFSYLTVTVTSKPQ
jgi:ParB/RepB/Spo0J family partition protein